LSSIWLILKQQWTIKISSPLFSIFTWWPSWLEVGITGHNFGRGPSKDHSTKVWFKLARWLQRSWLKCEKLTDGRTDDGRSVVTIAHMTLWVRWAKNNCPNDDKYRHVFFLTLILTIRPLALILFKTFSNNLSGYWLSNWYISCDLPCLSLTET
jgi:hypothetical protein